ncbi:MAG: hypothetical protein WBZ20_12235 [Nitrososphaeraceae archaeon]
MSCNRNTQTHSFVDIVNYCNLLGESNKANKIPLLAYLYPGLTDDIEEELKKKTSSSSKKSKVEEEEE